jgi:tRNA pseudouridine38-40 synthase
LNAILPDDIAVVKIEEADFKFHSRFSAKSKIYRYTILNRPSRPAIMRHMVYFLSYPLDLRLMRKEAQALVGRRNFKSFQATEKKVRGSMRKIKGINISRTKDLINIDIEADGFLYNMARSIVGTLIDIGRGRLPEGSMRKVLLAKNRSYSGQTAPPCGLCLLKVIY